MLIDQTASFAAAHDLPRMKDPVVLRHRAKVEYVPDPALAALMPIRVAIVDVTLADGTTLSERVEAVRGTVRNPMPAAEIEEKARDLFVPVLGVQKSNRLIEAVRQLETSPDLKGLRPLLQRG
jgi:2-methylcitrate dehydratase PrpD